MRNSIQHLSKILPLICICLIGFDSIAQEIAVNYSRETIRKNISETMVSKNDDLVSLDKVFDDLEKQYQVRFAYENKTIENKYVDLATARSLTQQPTHALDDILDEILQPLAISAKKVGDYYVAKEIQSITPKNHEPGSISFETSEEDNYPLQIRQFSKRELRIPQSLVQKSIQGQVTNENDEPLPGVSVLVKGTSIGTATGIDGNYKLAIPDDATTLVFSSVGYVVKEVSISDLSVINMKLLPDVKALNEIVVTALGIKKETKSLGYATASVESDQVTVNRTTNFMQSLQGKVAGVNISGMATGAGGSSTIRIRGQSAFAGANQPLIVVDGVPISNDRQYGGTQGANNSDAGDGLLSINPDIIESMSVLKGGAAAALYGSRAKDGVIMITTKNRGGKKGIGVTWNSNFTIDRAVDDTDFQYEYGQGERGSRPTSRFPDSGVWSFGEKIEPGMTQILYDNEEVPYVPQKNQITDFYNGGYTFTNTLSIAGSGDNGGFNLSLSQLNNDGITPNSGFDRYNVSLGFTQSITSRFTVSGNVNYSREIHHNPPQIVAQNMTSTKTIYTLANTMPLDVLERNQRDENGNEIIFSRFRNRTNPYLSVNDHFNDIDRDRVYGNITMKYNFTDWLYVQGRVGQDFYSKDQILNFPSLMAGIAPAPPGFVNGFVTQDQRRFREINSDFLIGADKEFGEKIAVNVTFGGNTMYRRFDRNSIQGQDFIVPFLYTVANTRVRDPLYEYSERKVNSLYGAAEFSYNDYLFLNVTARNDWFSTLSPEERSVLYPSVSGSFVFSQAFAGLPNWLTFGKVRAAYAEVGSDTDVDAFSQILGYNINSNLFQGPTSVQPLGTVSTNTIPNSSLRPMRVKEYEFGFNVQMFDRITFDFTYYNKLSIDQILEAAVSNTSGYTSQLINVGESVNRGVEMLFNITPISTDAFSWDISLNGAYNTSEVLKLGLDDADVSIGGTIRQVVGQPLGQIYNRGYLRDEQGRKIFNANSGLPESTAEEIRLGSAIPKWVGGITNRFNYKGIDVSFLIDFKLGHDLISSAEFDFVRHGKHKKTLVGREQGYVIGDGVTPDGSVNETQVELQTFYEADARIREDFVYNAGFWKLRQITLGYDFMRIPAVAKFLPVQGLTLSAVANNVYTIKRWTENMDPEQVHQINGTQDIALPMVRSYGFNLRVQL